MGTWDWLWGFNAWHIPAGPFATKSNNLDPKFFRLFLLHTGEPFLGPFCSNGGLRLGAPPGTQYNHCISFSLARGGRWTSGAHCRSSFKIAFASELRPQPADRHQRQRRRGGHDWCKNCHQKTFLPLQQLCSCPSLSNDNEEPNPTEVHLKYRARAAISQLLWLKGCMNVALNLLLRGFF